MILKLFYSLFSSSPLIHKYFTSFGYRYWRASRSATCGQRAITIFTWSAFKSLSRPITCCAIFWRDTWLSSLHWMSLYFHVSVFWSFRLSWLCFFLGTSASSLDVCLCFPDTISCSTWPSSLYFPVWHTIFFAFPFFFLSALGSGSSTIYGSVRAWWTNVVVQ